MDGVHMDRVNNSQLFPIGGEARIVIYMEVACFLCAFLQQTNSFFVNLSESERARMRIRGEEGTIGLDILER